MIVTTTRKKSLDHKWTNRCQLFVCQIEVNWWKIVTSYQTFCTLTMNFKGKRGVFDPIIMMKATCNLPPNVVESIFWKQKKDFLEKLSTTTAANMNAWDVVHASAGASVPTSSGND
jgi:hypothetical protein